MEKKDSNNFKPLYLLFFIVIVVQGIFGFIIWFSFDSMNERGTFGDMFGAINALFSGLAFCGVIYAILLQRRELELQREELTLTRKELKKSADAQQEISKQNKEIAEIQASTNEIQACAALIEYYKAGIVMTEHQPHLRKDLIAKQNVVAQKLESVMNFNLK